MEFLKDCGSETKNAWKGPFSNTLFSIKSFDVTGQIVTYLCTGIFALIWLILIISAAGKTKTSYGTGAVTCTVGEHMATNTTLSFVRQIRDQTGWNASPVVIDLDGDGVKEIVAALYNIYIYTPDGETLAVGEEGSGRVYAPHCVADIDGDGYYEIVAGRGDTVYTYRYTARGVLTLIWTATANGEIRGMSCGDLDHDGTIETVVSTTDSDIQIFVFDSQGRSYQPSDGYSPAWPRYNTLAGGDLDFNCHGNSGYGAYGLNVAIGNVDNDTDLEIIATYDNHFIQVFDKDGVALNASPYYTRRKHDDCMDSRMAYGQFIRWYDMEVEDNHYHLHEGEWPNVSWTEWLQWTASPPAVADLDGDGLNEILGAPNVEMDSPYDTKAYAVMVLEGAHSEQRAGRRKAGWEVLPRGEYPLKGGAPNGIPSLSFAALDDTEGLDIVFPSNDGHMTALSQSAEVLWRFDYTKGNSKIWATEAMIVDVTQDGRPEIIFSTRCPTGSANCARVFVLSSAGEEIASALLSTDHSNGNGQGASGPPTVADIDGDGTLEVLVQTYGNGINIFTIPGSANNCMIWSDSRGSLLRQGNSFFHTGESAGGASATTSSKDGIAIARAVILPPLLTGTAVACVICGHTLLKRRSSPASGPRSGSGSGPGSKSGSGNKPKPSIPPRRPPPARSPNSANFV